MNKMKAEIKKCYNEVKKDFPFSRYMDHSLSKYFSIISIIMKECPPKSKILSVGSGPCDLEAVLSKIGYDVTAIDDLSDHWHLIGKNRERIKNFAKKMYVKLLVKSAGSLKLKENTFDVVLLISIVEHLHGSPRELLNYSISLLKSNGMLLIEVPNTVALAKRLKVLFGKSNQVSADFIYWNVGEYRSHVREYTRSEIKQILSHHDLVAINSKMENIMINMVENTAFLKKIVIKGYKLISNLYPNFRDTILISGKKPEDWSPTDDSIDIFKRCYSHIERYNLDNESNDVLISKMKGNS